MNTEVCIVNNASLRAGTLLMIPTWAPSVTTTVQILLRPYLQERNPAGNGRVETTFGFRIEVTEQHKHALNSEL